MSNRLKMIPLSELKPSKTNVRKTGKDSEIAALAASIEANGLLENLVVVPAAGGRDKGYEVVAGGRRLMALRLLAKRKQVARDLPVACLVRDAADATELSLAENFVRVPLHPADQFDAFFELVRQGQAIDDIAARFGVTAAFVGQRLKLSSVSPCLIAAYRDAEMTLEQLTAFTVVDDHGAQEQVWFGLPYKEMPADTIRRYLTASKVATSDRRVAFVGVDAYRAAGGVVSGHLFDADNGGYLDDSALLDRLVGEKLGAAAGEVRAEGWQWVEVRPDMDHAWLGRFGRAKTVVCKLDKADRKQLVALRRSYDKEAAALEDSDTGWSDDLERLAAEIAALEAKTIAWPDDEKSRAGAVVCLGPDGGLQVVRGLVKADEARPEPDDSAKRPVRSEYPDAVLLDLSAHRTAALRELLAANPEVALLELLRTLVGRLFYSWAPPGCITVSASEIALDRASPSVGTSPAAAAFARRHAHWQTQMPECEKLPAWLNGLTRSDRLRLLGHCVSLTVDALHASMQRLGTEADSNRLAGSLGLDMTRWWRPTGDNFLSRLTKAQVLAAVSQGVSPEAGQRLAGLKKDALVAEAERLLKDTRWLPRPLQPQASEDTVAAD